MKRIFTAFFLFLFSAALLGAEIPFEVIDVDGEGHVGQITAIDADSIQLATVSGDLTFPPQRVEIVQNLSPNPFLIQNKSNDANRADIQKFQPPNRRQVQRTVIINGQVMIVNEWGNIIPKSNQPRTANKKVLPPILKKLHESGSDKNTDTQEKKQKIPQFPPSVIVIELLDGSRLVATRFVVKEQKAICNLLDQNYVVDEKNIDKKSKPEINKEKKEIENNAKTNGETGGEVASSVIIPFDQIYSVRFAVKSFTDIFDPSAEWLKYTAEAGTSGDRIVINKSGVFDVYSGIISEVTPEAVIFTIDNEKLPVQRGKIYGIILHSPNREQIKRKTISSGQITLWTGTQLMLDSFVLKQSEKKTATAATTSTATENFRNDNSGNEAKDKNAEVDDGGVGVVDAGLVAEVDSADVFSEGKILWKALAGFSGETFLSEVDNIVFSRGNSLYLDELIPVIRERLLPFEWGGGMSKSDNTTPISKMKLFQAGKFGIGKSDVEKFDPSLESVTPLTLRNTKQMVNQPIPAIEGVILDGVSYRRGVMLSPKTTLEYAVTDAEQSYSAIRGFVGVDDRLKPNGRAKLIIDVDGKMICTIEVCGTDAVKLLRYELPKTHKKITITIDFADNVTESVPISIGDLKLIK
ncbi:MAG: NPCBM/NEW2 domain-containing protein [Planctomycetaceae bacterium]|jgi:hypothetical protein|nr:NPCBM/NEW2 domain-containing protein [Planctomycetaceae bacterium]